MWKACSSAVMELESPETTESTSSEFALCTSAAKMSPAGTTSSETFLPKLSATETALVKSICSCSLKLCCSALKIFGAAHAHHAHAEDDDVLLVGVGARERPLEREGIGGVAHGDHDAAGTDGDRLAADGVLMLELEVVLHLARGEGVLAQVLPLRDGEDDEEARRQRRCR